MAEIKVGSLVKLKHFGDVDSIAGSCESRAKLNGVDLTTELEVVHIEVDWGVRFLYFAAPYRGFSGMLEARFEVIP